jgi:hypothetical protein
MATNSILKFGENATSILSQTQYEDDAQRMIGHQPGPARSALENKVLKQVSVIAAGVAEFIADKQTNNVTDLLDRETLAQYLSAAIVAAIPSATSSVAGKTTMASASEAQQYQLDSKAITPLTMKNAMQGGNQSLSTNGYQMFPGGLIWQWGKVSNYQPDAPRVITFPIAFPAALFCAQVSMSQTGFVNYANVPIIVRGTESLTGMSVSVDYSIDKPVVDLYWIAIGN